jgi:hypothetical protein
MKIEEKKWWRVYFWEIGPKGGKRGLTSQLTSQGYDEAMSLASDWRGRGFGASVAPAYRSSLMNGELK